MGLTNYLRKKNQNSGTELRAFEDNTLNEKFKADALTLYYQNDPDPLGNAQKAVSQYRDTALASYKLNAANPLKAAADQHDATMYQRMMQNLIAGKSAAQIIDLRQKTAQGIVPGKTSQQIQLENMQAQAAGKETQSQQMTKWLDKYIKHNTKEGAQEWVKQDPDNSFAKDTLYFQENAELYSGTPEEIFLRVQEKNRQAAQQKGDEMTDFLQEMKALSQRIYESGMTPQDYFMGGKGTAAEMEMWQRLNDVENMELFELTKYAMQPWDDDAQAIVDNYSFTPEDIIPWDESLTEYDEERLKKGNLFSSSSTARLLDDDARYAYRIELPQSVQKATGYDPKAYQALLNLGQAEADEYWNYYSYAIDEAINDIVENGMTEFAEKNPVLATPVSWITNVGRGINYLDVLGQNILRNAGLREDRPLNYERSAGLGIMTDAIQGTVAENIENDNLRMLYNTGNGIANTLLTTPLGTGGAAVVMGSQSAQQRMQELKKMQEEMGIEDLTDNKILWGGAAAGVMEYAFEKISLGKLFDTAQNLTKGGFKNFLKDLAINTGVNASEEAFTEAGNLLYDFLSMGENSDFGQNVKYYKSMGLNNGQAIWRAMGDAAADIGEAGFGGGLQGLIMGGGASTISGINRGRAAKDAGGVMSEESRKDLLDTAKTMDKNSRVRKLAEKMGENPTDTQMGKLYMEMLQEAFPDNYLNRAEIVEMAKDDAGISMMNAMLEGQTQAEAEAAEATEAAEAAVEAAETTEATEAAEAEETTEATEETEEDEEIEEEERPAYVSNLEGLGLVEEDADGYVTIKNEEGKEIDLDETDLPEGEKAVIRQGAEQPEQILSAMRDTYKKVKEMLPEDAREWAEAFVHVAKKAQQGAALENIQDVMADDLTEEQKKAAWEAGNKARTEGSAWRNAKNVDQARRYGYEADNGKADQTGVVFADVTQTIDKGKQTMLMIINEFANKYGMKVRVLDSLGSQNAQYKKGTNQIDLALDAEEGALTRVVSHEMFHFVAENNEENAWDLRTMVQAHLEKNGVDTFRIVADIQAKAKAQGVELTEQEAMDEMTADGLLDYLGTTENIQALVKDNRSVAQKIADWVKSALDYLRQIMKKVAGKNEVVQALYRDEAYMAEVSRAMDTILQNTKALRDRANKNLFDGVKNMENVQEYVAATEAAATTEQAQQALDKLVEEAYTKTQTQDAQETDFRDALAAYGRNEGNLPDLLQEKGLDAPNAGTDEMRMLAYTGQQISLFDAQQMEDVPEIKGEYAYSLKDDNDELTFWAELAQESALGVQAKEDENINNALNAYRKLHQQRGETLSQEKIDKLATDVAQKLIDNTGTTINKAWLTKQLKQLYRGMSLKNTELQYTEAESVQMARHIAKRMFEKYMEENVYSESENAIRNIVRYQGFSLNEDQKSAVAARYGSVRAFMQRNFGRMKIRKFDKYGKGAASLAEIWHEELTQLNPSVFNPDVNDGDMPEILEAYLDKISRRKTNAEGMDTDLEYQITENGLRILLDYYGTLYDDASLNKAIKQKGNVTGEAERTLLHYNPELVRRMRDEMQSSITAMQLEYEERYEERVTTFEKRKKEREKLQKEIKRNAKFLNDRLLRNTPEKHIPAELKGAIRKAMEAMTQKGGVFNGARLQDLRMAYKALSQNGMYADTEAARKYDERILEEIEYLEKSFKYRSIKSLTAKQLEAVNIIMKHLRNLVETVNTVYVDERRENFENFSNRGMDETRAKKSASDNAILKRGSKYFDKNTTPIMFFRNMGGIWQKMFADVMKAESECAFVLQNTQTFFDRMMDKYHVNEWIQDKTLKFTTVEGDKLEMDKQLAMSLVALWNREHKNVVQKANHLEKGGFKYTGKEKYEGVDMHKTHRLTQMDINTIQNYLGEEALKFVDEMVGYLSHDMAAIGNKTSTALYGYDKFGEGYYFPYDVSKDFISSDLSKMSTDEAINALRGWGASKELTRRANKPLAVGKFTETWRKHCEQMAVYGNFTVPIDNIQKVFNYVDTDNVSMKSEIRRVYGDYAGTYIANLVRDIAGGVTLKDRSGSDKMISLYKKASVAASLSVAVQQPTAMFRAWAVINPKYFVGAVNPVREWKELTKYSGVAVLKSIGRFDTGTGMTAQEWITESLKDQSKAKRAIKKMDEAAGFLPEKMDQMTWAMIWHAVKKESKAKGIDISTEEGLKKAGQRFDEVARLTQVYDSTISRSDLMRSNTSMDKMMTAFMAEPTMTINLMRDAIRHIGDKSYPGKINFGRAFGAVVLATLANAIVKSLVTAGRKDDEKRTFTEKYAAEVAENFISDINPLSMLPKVRDLMSLFQGYDVERADMSVVSDALDGLDVIKNLLFEDEKKYTWNQYIEKGLGPIANLAGVPLKNVARDVRSAYNIFWGSEPLKDTKGSVVKYSVLDNLPFGIWESKNTAYYERMMQALEDGDEEAYDELLNYMTTAKGTKEETVKSGVQEKIKEGVQKGHMTEENAQKILVDNLGKEKDDAFWLVDKWQSGKGNEYSKFDELMEAIDQQKSPNAAVKKLLDNDTKASDVRREITKEFKPKYKELYKKNKAQAANLKAYLLTALSALGYDRAKASKDIDEWLTQD